MRGGRGRRIVRALVNDNKSWAWVVVSALLVGVYAGAELHLVIDKGGADANGTDRRNDCRFEHFNLIIYVKIRLSLK